MRRCPACRVNYASVSEHLWDVHGVTVKVERRLLISMQSGRYTGPLPCPEARCNKVFVRLDRHLASVHKVMDEGKKEMLKGARHRAIKERLKLIHQEKDYRKDIAALQLVVRLLLTQMLSLERTLQKEISVVGKEIVTHRQEVHSEKSKKLLTVDQLSMFKEFAAKEIPKSLNKLKKDPLRDTYLRQCVGLLAGYLFTLSGHRKGVLVSLLEKEVLKCERSGDDYVIYAKSYKTAATYGRAKLALTKTEYTWLTDFAKLRPLLPGYSPEVPTFFLTLLVGSWRKWGTW